ncbi:hypothetical protein [Sphingomonas pituitosa]|uniref:hypothetical protein n=1 Tax=Sphingomonas pituitosa TaxID=99597 RepID=UPI000A8EB405|nr:hypothetical protein [Sphingomonas pituitosa]
MASLVHLAAVAAALALEPATKRPSLLDDLPRLAPAIACLDAAPLDDEAAVRRCVTPTGLRFNDNVAEPRSLGDFEVHAVSMWAAINRGPDRQRNSPLFVEAIGYARCVESAAYADQAFASRTRQGVMAARLRSEIACAEHPLSPRRAAADAGDMRARFSKLYARLLSALALTYALEANGWFPDEMRECFRYADGRPPSAGCKGKALPIAPVAPPK